MHTACRAIRLCKKSLQCILRLVYAHCLHDFMLQANQLCVRQSSVNCASGSPGAGGIPRETGEWLKKSGVGEGSSFTSGEE
jgi:hypothetical protein